MKRAGGRCERCGERPPTSVHHVKPLAFGGPLLADESELQAVCADCRPIVDDEAVREARRELLRRPS